jgi:hypothetical protein
MQLYAAMVGGMIRLLLGLPIEQGSDQADGGAEVANEGKQAHGENSDNGTIPHGPGLARLVTDHYGADRSIKKRRAQALPFLDAA